MSVKLSLVCCTFCLLIFSSSHAQSGFVPFFQFGSTYLQCSTPDGKSGTCYNIRRCQSLIYLLLNMDAIPGALNYLRQSICGYEGNDPMMCCSNENDQSVPNPSPTQYTLPAVEENCGVSGANYMTRVVNGVPAQLGAWPWAALLGYKSSRNSDVILWQCGGTLITKRHVITAAHCINEPDDNLQVVRLGELDTARNDEGANPIDIPVQSKIKHENFNSKQFTNDIGLVKLKNDVTFTRLISPICLPTTQDTKADTYERKLPFVAGWGTTSYGGAQSSHLQQVQIPVVTNDECRNSYLSFSTVIDDRVVCAGYAKGGKDACQGDSGGPLMLPYYPSNSDSLRYFLIGIVSYGYKCAEAGYPGVYTRVSNFIPWIESRLNV